MKLVDNWDETCPDRGLKVWFGMLWFRRVLNFTLYLVFCFMLGTGLLLTLRLVPGREGGKGLEVWGMSRHEWGDIHYAVSLVFLVLVVVHLWMERKWLAKVAAKGGTWKLVGGLSVGAVLVIGLATLPVKRDGERVSGSTPTEAGGCGEGQRKRHRHGRAQVVEEVAPGESASESSSERGQGRQRRMRGGRTDGAGESSQ